MPIKVEIGGYVKEHPDCSWCGKPAHFWLHLGDFVVGYPTSTQPICLDCLDKVVSKCVYASSEWRSRPRFYEISTNQYVFDDDTLQKVKARVDEEWRRAYGNSF